MRVDSGIRWGRDDSIGERGWMELSDSFRRHDEPMTANDAYLAVICDGWVAEGV